MSQMKSLLDLLTELRDCGEKMIEIAESMKDFYSAKEEPAPKPAAPKPAPTPEPEELPFPVETISFEDLRKILAEKSSAEGGKYKAKVKALVVKYSITGTLKGVPVESYDALLKECEVIANG